MENRIKECQLDLYADRTSAHTMRANQLRLWFASMAYVLICALRRIGLAHTQFARASCGTIRLKLLKIGALVRTSVRRIKLAMPSAFPYQAEYRAAHAALTPPRPDEPDSAADISPRNTTQDHCPHAGLAKVETSRFNPQPPLSSRARPGSAIGKIARGEKSGLAVAALATLAALVGCGCCETVIARRFRWIPCKSVLIVS